MPGLTKRIRTDIVIFSSRSFRRGRSMNMEKIKRTFSFRKKKDHVPECSKPHQWQEDERKVRDGTCSFQVRYLGCIEVFESRGMHVCEEAIKALKQQCKGKYQRAVLYVSGDALRVVDEISKGLIVDQTIEKVSFCAPDRNHDRGFAYICRDGTTRRWICHGFLAMKDSGERLSHAVGCAFAICLERKQKRDKESGVTVTYNENRTSFERTGSFRHTTLTEKLQDPQSAIVAEPIPNRVVDMPHAIERPHATPNMLERMGSFRGFSKLNESSSPFKRQLSLRVNELPSTLQRQKDTLDGGDIKSTNGPGTIHEASPGKEEESISNMCQQLSQGLAGLNTDDPFAAVPRSSTQPTLSGPVHPQPQPHPAFAPTGGSQVNPWDTQTPGSFWLETQQQQPQPFNNTNTSVGGGDIFNPAARPGGRAPSLSQTRSHSIDTGEVFSQQQKRHLANTQSSTNQNWKSFSQEPDPFDVAWASKTPSNGSTTNPFSSNSVKAFEVNL